MNSVNYYCSLNHGLHYDEQNLGSHINYGWCLWELVRHKADSSFQWSIADLDTGLTRTFPLVSAAAGKPVWFTASSPCCCTKLDGSCDKLASIIGWLLTTFATVDDFKRLNGMNFSELCRILVRFGPVTQEFTLLKRQLFPRCGKYLGISRTDHY